MVASLVLPSGVVQQVATFQRYVQALPALMQITLKPAHHIYSRRGTKIDEIVLHGTESLRPENESANYLASANDRGVSIHYFIGRDYGTIYTIVPEEKAAGHAGNPKHLAGVTDHNPRSIGIEMYQKDISLLGGDKSKLNFTDWQYDALSQLCYDICHRRGIKRDMIVSHKSINSVQRADPQGFDWDRFNDKIDILSIRMGFAFGNDYKLA